MLPIRRPIERLSGRLSAVAAALAKRPGVFGWPALAVFVIALFSTAVPTTLSVYRTPVALTFLTFTILCGGILIAPLFPRVGSLLTLAALAGLLALAALGPTTNWPLPITGLLAWCALIVVLGVSARWFAPVAVWGAGIVLIWLIPAVVSRPISDLTDWQGRLTVDASVSALVLALSATIGQRRRIRAQLASARRDARLEHARREHAEERGRIAREMHDVVVHSMSLVHMQASSAPYRIPDLDEETRAEFENIARSARAALDEMRQVLDVLRPDASEQPLSPQPQLADLEDLALVTTRAGSRVTLSVDAELERVPAVVQLALYRTVQEALGNSVRHSPGAAVSVRVQIVENDVQVESTNGPASPPAALHRPAEAPGIGGRGLQGIRERAAQLRGRTEFGPTREGGFRLFATFPLDAEAERNGTR